MVAVAGITAAGGADGAASGWTERLLLGEGRGVEGNPVEEGGDPGVYAGPRPDRAERHPEADDTPQGAGLPHAVHQRAAGVPIAGGAFFSVVHAYVFLPVDQIEADGVGPSVFTIGVVGDGPCELLQHVGLLERGDVEHAPARHRQFLRLYLRVFLVRDGDRANPFIELDVAVEF